MSFLYCWHSVHHQVTKECPPTDGVESPQWADILRFCSIRVNLFGLWFSLNPRFGSTTGWCRTSLLLQCHPIAGQRRYPLKVLYTVDVALQGKNAIHDNMLNRRSILSSSKWMRFTRVSQVSALHRICLLAKLFQRLLLFWGMVAKPCPKDATS